MHVQSNQRNLRCTFLLFFFGIVEFQVAQLRCELSMPATRCQIDDSCVDVGTGAELVSSQ